MIKCFLSQIKNVLFSEKKNGNLFAGNNLILIQHKYYNNLSIKYFYNLKQQNKILVTKKL